MTTILERVKALESTRRITINSDLDGYYRLMAADSGRVLSCQLSNGSVATDGSNGYEIQVVNKSDSDNKLGWFGFGSGTEAAKADDKDAATAAYTTESIDNTTNSSDRFNKGDEIEITIDRDGTTVNGTIAIVFEFGSVGRV